MQQEEPIYKGILLLPPVGKLLKKSWQQKYCQLFKASKFGIERLEVFDAVDAKESKIITLENCVKVFAKSSRSFCITFKTASYEFEALTETSMNEWLSAIQAVAFSFTNVSQITSIEEDNELYSSYGEGVFNVKLHPSTVSDTCGLENKTYTLVLTSTAIQLRNILDGKLLYTWPYCYIRRYGYKNGMFTFEAGRKCESGEGTFFLEHPNQQDIFKCLATKIKSMKKLLAGETTPPLLDCGDVQLHAALTMEARSRTPLPVSPISQSMQESTISNKSHMLIMSDFNHSKLSLINAKSEKTPELPITSKAQFLKTDSDRPRPIQKSKPTKPPRKYVPTVKPVTDRENTYEPVQRNYDHPEHRNNTRPNMGIETPNHMEQVNDDDDDDEQIYSSWGAEAKQEISAKPLPVPIFIPKNQSMINLDDDNYDKLNFFGPTNKINVEAGYKQVYPIPINPVPDPPSYNEYDEVQCLNLESSTDTIRNEMDAPKEINLMNAKEEMVNHQFHNGDQYAMISKPKRV